LTDRSVEFRV